MATIRPSHVPGPDPPSPLPPHASCEEGYYFSAFADRCHFCGGDDRLVQYLLFVLGWVAMLAFLLMLYQLYKFLLSRGYKIVKVSPHFQDNVINWFVTMQVRRAEVYNQILSIICNFFV